MDKEDIGNDTELLNFEFRLRRPYQDEAKDDSAIQSPRNVSFGSIGRRYITSLQLLWNYIKSVAGVAYKTNSTNLVSLMVLLSEVAAHGRKYADSDECMAIADATITFRSNNEESQTNISCRVFDSHHLSQLRNHTKYYNAAKGILFESAIQQLANTYEYLIGELLRQHLRSDPDAAPKDQSITYRNLLTFASLDEAKDHVIEKEVVSFIKNKNTSEQLTYIKDELHADLSSHFRKLPELKEMILRRHMIVHTGGIATTIYRRELSKIKGYKGTVSEVGSKLPLSSEYVEESWATTYSAGVILLHIVARRYAQTLHNKDDENVADDVLLDAAYQAIVNEQYGAAEAILLYASKLRLASDTHDLMVCVNLAQTLKWQGKITECEEVLGKRDWDAANIKFQLCVAALRQDWKSFEKLLPMVAAQRKIEIHDMIDWPVFKEARKLEEYSRWVQTAFNQDILPEDEDFIPSILNFDADSSLEKILDRLTLLVNREPEKEIEKQRETK